MITVAQVKASLIAAADEHGEHIDARVERQLPPRYVEHGKPCCLVAVVLHDLGFTVPQLRQLDHEAGRHGGGVMFDQSRHPLLRRISPEARNLLSYVQRRQDTGHAAWTEVVDQALQRGRFAPDQPRAVFNYDRIAGAQANTWFAWNQPDEVARNDDRPCSAATTDDR